jgi:hypothetical protein
MANGVPPEIVVVTLVTAAAFSLGFVLGVMQTPRLTQQERAALKSVSPWVPPGVEVVDILKSLEKRL